MGSKAPSRVRIPQSPPVAKHCVETVLQKPASKCDPSIAKHRCNLHNSASAPVAQLDRAPGYELGGREFESLRARHTNKKGRCESIGPSCLWALAARVRGDQKLRSNFWQSAADLQ